MAGNLAEQNCLGIPQVTSRGLMSKVVKIVLLVEVIPVGMTNQGVA